MSGTEPEHWYEREPERLAWELDEFERHGLTAATSYDDEGRLVVKTQLRFRSAPAEIEARYPHGYPHFPPTVVGEARLLDRHQDPVGLNYCLLEDHENDWHPARSAGQLIGKNLRALLKDTEAGKAAIREGEADMAEPVGAQFLYDDQVVILVAEPFLVDDLGATRGAMALRRGPGHVRILADAEGIGTDEPELVEQYAPGGTEVAGRWVALDAPPRPEDFPQSVLQAINGRDPSILARLDRQLRRKKSLPFARALVGLTFIEQGPTRDEERRNWMFAEIEQKRGYEPGLRRLLLPAQALSQAERQRRIPELSGLDRAHVVVIGAGSLGAPVMLELAKAGFGRLDVIDPDRYDVNNAVRHPLATQRAGEVKAEATARRMSAPESVCHGERARSRGRQLRRGEPAPRRPAYLGDPPNRHHGRGDGRSLRFGAGSYRRRYDDRQRPDGGKLRR